MNLDESQRKKVTEWIGQGLKLSEIQSRLASESGLRLTYMEVRLLVDDLKLTPVDIERPKVPAELAGSSAAQPAKGSVAKPAPASKAPEPNRSGVAVSVDQLTRPGAVVSGKVTFGDGHRAEWYLDQSGRLGLAPEQAGWRPPAAEVQEFQMALEKELSKIGF